MSYLVVNIVDGQLKVIRERNTWDEAVAVAAKMAAEQTDVSEEDARIELDRDANFVRGDIDVEIAQADDEGEEEPLAPPPRPEIEAMFECPSCGSHRLEEVLTGVTVSSPITSVGEGGDIDYGEPVCHEDGEVNRYQCLDCGWIIKQQDEPITQCDELWEYMNDPDRECKPGSFKK